MDMILKDLEAKYEMLTDSLEQAKKELEEMDVTNFALQPEIAKLTAEIADLTNRREVIDFQIVNYKANLEMQVEVLKENGGQ